MPDKLHPLEIATLVPSEEMGRQLMALRYDLLVPVLRGMAAEALRQANGDREKGRPQLGATMSDMALNLRAAAVTAEEAALICNYYIEAEKFERLRAR